MNTIDNEELEVLIDQFLNERGLWGDFQKFIEQKGYSVNELPGILGEE